MRVVFIFCIAIFNILFCYGQDSTVYSYKIDYDMRLNFSGYNNFISTLYFNNKEAYFEYKIKIEGQSETINDTKDNEGISANISDTATYYFKSNLSTNSIIELARGFDNASFYHIKDTLSSIAWIITDTVKNIGKYTCYKARCRFAGRNYTVWFTPDIAAYFGPWKLHGLPGLILEAGDDRGEVEFFAKNISSISIPVSKFNYKRNYPVITKKEYAHKINSFLNDLKDQMTSKLGRGFKVKVSAPKINTIEVYEE